MQLGHRELSCCSSPTTLFQSPCLPHRPSSLSSAFWTRCFRFAATSHHVDVFADVLFGRLQCLIFGPRLLAPPPWSLWRLSCLFSACCAASDMCLHSSAASLASSSWQLTRPSSERWVASVVWRRPALEVSGFLLSKASVSQKCMCVICVWFCTLIEKVFSMSKYTGHPHIVSLPKFCTSPLKIDGPIPCEMTISNCMCLGCEHSQCKSGLSEK